MTACGEPATHIWMWVDGSVYGVMVIVVRSGLGYSSLNPEQGSLDFKER